MKTLTLLFLLVTTSVIAQNSSEIPADTTRKYCFSEQEILKFAEWKTELDYCKTENKRLTQRDSLNVLLQKESSIKIFSQSAIIDLQYQQISKLLQEPKQVTYQSNWKWYEIGGLAVSCVAIGVLTGLLIK